ncbi:MULTISPECIES: hypothetical protein [unclassified Streptomyces]
MHLVALMAPPRLAAVPAVPAPVDPDAAPSRSARTSAVVLPRR